jgi:hypothetical protein
MMASFRWRFWIRLVVMTVVATLAGAAFVIWHVSPLTTHVLREPPNSSAAVAPIPLPGLAMMPALLDARSAGHRWEIVGGSLLQIGLSRAGVVALERAVAERPGEPRLRLALGEALVLARGGEVTPEAKAHFDAVLAADPNDLIARYYMAHWLLQNGKAKPALVKWVGLMRAVGTDTVWYGRLWDAMPQAAEQAGVSPLALQALCVAGM